MTPGARRRAGLGVLVLAWGAQAIVTQSLLLREAMVLASGSELAWGMVLFAWLLGITLGAGIGGRLAASSFGERHSDPALVSVVLLLGAVTCLEIWGFREARGWLGVESGGILPLTATVFAVLVLVPPSGALVGMSFPLACSIVMRDANGRAAGVLLPFGRVYALESAGSLIGGAVFSFWAVDHLSPIQTTLVVWEMTAVVGTAYLIVQERRCRWFTSVAVLGVLFGLLAIGAGEAWNRWLVERRWRHIAPGHTLVAEAESRYQNLALGRRAEQYTLYGDGQVTVEFPDPYAVAPWAHLWLCQHPAPLTVLLIGGGADGLLTEILRHPVERVEYIEPDPGQIDLLQPFLDPAQRRALADPRVAVHHVDARFYVKRQQARFDLVIARLPDPISARRARFYTDEFFGELRRAMRPRSMLCMTAAAAPGELPAMSREFLATLRTTLARHFPDVIIGWGDPAPVLAGSIPGLATIDPQVLTQRFAQRGVESEVFHPSWFDGATDRLDADKVARRGVELDALDDAPISTDHRPVTYVQRLAYWESVTGGGGGPGRTGKGAIGRLRSIPFSTVIAVAVALALLPLWIERRRRGGRGGWASGAIVVSIATTGFTTMALSLIWLFAFQNLYGYVYQRIGWIIALFMTGLVIGSLAAQRLASARVARTPSTNGNVINDRAWRGLIAVDGALAALSGATPVVLVRLGNMQDDRIGLVVVEWCVSVLLVVTGFLGGAGIVLAARWVQGRGVAHAAAAASVVGADHAGACLGALSCGILLVPVHGTVAAALLLAGLKLIAVAVLLVTRRFTSAA